MKVLGLITEYNPFHNGHLHHLEKSREITGCDTVVCVMSGNFIQRGLPALTNKWSRAEMALNNQVDLIIELPVYYAVSSAEFFAHGAVKLLDSLGFVDSLCFGSECGEIDLLKIIAFVLAEEPAAYKEKLCRRLEEGLSFPAARSLALQDYFSQNSPNDLALVRALIDKPNNILGIEYMKALKRLNSTIKPSTIRRYKADYNSYKQYGSIASATAIRKILASNELEVVKSVVPESSYNILRREISEGRGPVFSESFELAILSMLRKMSSEELRGVNDVTEGIENRIIKAAQESGSLSELLDRIKTKRYTLTRLQRILTCILLGLSRDNLETFNSAGGPQYIRVLGFSEKGEELLGKIKASSLPLVTNLPVFLKNCTALQKKMLEADILASDIYCLGYPSASERLGGQDFYQKIITV